MGRFEGKVAVITGASSGIGLATARRFAQEGARTFMMARRQAELERAVRTVGYGAVGVQGDVSQLADLDVLYDRVRQEAGSLDILFANAGGGEFAPLGAITEEHYEATFATNVKGVLFTVQKALPLLKEGGSVVLTGSVTGTSGTPAFSVYSATKAAVRNFARNWILDLRDRRIRVNVVSPGVIDTAGLDGLFGGRTQAEGVKSDLIKTIPSGRVGRSEDVANAVLFLASDEAAFVNGAELFVDGGMTQI